MAEEAENEGSYGGCGVREVASGGITSERSILVADDLWIETA